jgi:ribose transport system substrate-binding protein
LSARHGRLARRGRGDHQGDAGGAGRLGSRRHHAVGIGKCVVDSLAKVLKGEKLDKIIDSGLYWYDKSNIRDPKVAAVIYD